MNWNDISWPGFQDVAVPSVTEEQGSIARNRREEQSACVEIAGDLQSYPHRGEFHDFGGDTTDILDAGGRSIGDGGVDAAERGRFRTSSV